MRPLRRESLHIEVAVPKDQMLLVLLPKPAYAVLLFICNQFLVPGIQGNCTDDFIKPVRLRGIFLV